MTYKYSKSGLLYLSGGGPLCFMESVGFVYIVPEIRQKQYQSAMGGMFQHPLFWNAARISTDVARRKNICYQFPGVLRGRFPKSCKKQYQNRMVHSRFGFSQLEDPHVGKQIQNKLNLMTDF